MSGNTSIYDELKKNDHNKKRAKLKFVTAIALTNILVALACYSFFSESHSAVATITTEKKTLHPHFKMIIAPLHLLIENNEAAKEIPVSLMDKDKKILVRTAYLHEEVPGKSSEASTGRFKIEIPEEDLMKLSADENTPMIAIPQLQKVLSTVAVKKRVSKYEVNF